MNDILKIIKVYINISIDDNTTIQLIEAELRQLPNNEVNMFMSFMRDNQTNKNLEFKSGFQKFIYLIDKFKENRLRLDNNELMKINSYADTLNDKIITLFEALNDELYKNKVSPLSDEGKKYLYCEQISNNILSYLGNNGLTTTNKIGRQELCRLVKHNRFTLLETIKKVVSELVQNKKVLELGYSYDVKRLN